jgi:hypothetical protein
MARENNKTKSRRKLKMRGMVDINGKKKLKSKNKYDESVQAKDKK